MTDDELKAELTPIVRRIHALVAQHPERAADIADYMLALTSRVCDAANVDFLHGAQMVDRLVNPEAQA